LIETSSDKSRFFRQCIQASNHSTYGCKAWFGRILKNQQLKTWTSSNNDVLTRCSGGNHVPLSGMRIK
jgi:hypothetical protein